MDICSRILRRGSFAHLSITGMLLQTLFENGFDAMAADGETHCLDDGSCRRWERIAKKETLLTSSH